MKRIALMSIKPIYAQKIYNSSKTVELRRRYSKLSDEDIVVIYESSPVQKITGYFVVREVEYLPLTKLWDIAKSNGQISKKEFYSYFHQIQYGVAIHIKAAQKFKSALCLNCISPDVKAPQSYRYISAEQFKRIIDQQ